MPSAPTISSPIKKKKVWKPQTVITLSFLWAIAAGTLLLKLPQSTVGEGLSLMDALFTATSAVCVTGLTVVRTDTAFTFFGQCIIMALIQIGGLGIMTLSTFFLLLLRQKVNLQNQRLIEGGFIGRSKAVNGKTLLIWVCGLAFLIEAAGAGVLFARFLSLGYAAPDAAWNAVFHSISAFCNAGFDLFGDSLIRFRSDAVVIGTFSALIFLGGLGFVVLINIIRNIGRSRGQRRFSLQTKISLAAAALLLGAGFVVFLLAESDRLFWDMSQSTSFLSAFFLSVVPRTAGFYSVNIGALSYMSTLFLMFLMFVGATSGSTGGGIKTTTMAVLVAASRGLIRGKKHIEIMNKTVPEKVVREAICVTVLAAAIVFTGVLVLFAVEYGNSMISNDFFERVMFEAVSAFGTVGLSTGITPFLSGPGKFVLVLMMIVGRVGPLVISVSIGKQEEVVDVKYAEEHVLVG